MELIHGVARGATIKVHEKVFKSKHPVQKLYPLELRDTQDIQTRHNQVKKEQEFML